MPFAYDERPVAVLHAAHHLHESVETLERWIDAADAQRRVRAQQQQGPRGGGVPLLPSLTGTHLRMPGSSKVSALHQLTPRRAHVPVLVDQLSVFTAPIRVPKIHKPSRGSSPSSSPRWQRPAEG